MKLVIANWVEKFKTHRISFTFPVLNNAAEVMFLVSGPDKAGMVHQVLEGKSNPPYPSQQVQPSNGMLLWILDETAAQELSKNCAGRIEEAIEQETGTYAAKPRVSLISRRPSPSACSNSLTRWRRCSNS